MEANTGVRQGAFDLWGAFLCKGMSHEPKSPSLGMLSTATRTTATVSPLAPSPINGALVPSGSPAANSTLQVQAVPSSSFAAALRKLAKQAEDPRGSSISSESSPVSSPATNHSSPASTPKRGPMGPLIVPPGGHSVPNTPPVVTIAPTKTVNGIWRSEGRHQEAGSRSGGGGSNGSRDRLIAEAPLPQEKGSGPTVPSHLLGTPYSFAIPPNSIVQDSRFPPLNLQRPVHHVVPPSAVTEDYLRSFRPYHTAEELRMSSLPPLTLDPATAAAYYHPSYLAHHPFPHPAFRMDDSYCLSALRSPFYPIPTPGSLPHLHPSAMHLHLSGMRYPAELSHSSLSALQSERLSSLTAERLQLDEELRQREREKEREREADREREREREKELERERERERERELERQRERAREKEQSIIKAMEGPFLSVSELQGPRTHPAEERVKPSEQLTPNRAEKPKDSSAAQTPKVVQPPLHQPSASQHPVPSLISSHTIFPPPGGSTAAALLIQRTNEEEKWLARQRRLRQEKEDRQSQVSEFRQQVLEQHLDIGRPAGQMEVEHRPENSRLGPSRPELGGREQPQHFGGPPPLISPKPQPHPVPTSLWNPVSLIESTMEARRLQESHSLPAQASSYEPSRQAIPLVKVERVYCPEKVEDGARKKEPLDKHPSGRETGGSEPGGFPHGPLLSEWEKPLQQRTPHPQSVPFAEALKSRTGSPYRHLLPRGHDPMYVYDEFLLQQRKLVSKLDLEERKRREAQEKGYYYDLDDSYDESDEEEVRAHLRCVAEQPPLKLDTSSEKLEFLQLFGLTTQQQKEELLIQKRRKRRRMLRESSPSPPTIQNKRPTPPPRFVLSTRYSPDEMNHSPNFEEKKRFLTTFNLTHITADKRKDKEKLAEMLHAMKQKNTCTAPPVKSSPRDSPSIVQADSQVQQTTPSDLDKPVGVAPASLPEAQKPMESCRTNHLRPHDFSRAKEPVPLPAAEKPRLSDGHTVKKNFTLLNCVRGPLPKEIPVPLSHSMNGKNKQWEPFLAEEFAHQFHESVLQSTQKALQKHKGNAMAHSAEQNHKVDASIHYNIPELQTSSWGSLPQQNGQKDPQHKGSIPPEHQKISDSEEDEEDEEEEEEYPRPKWHGIEAVFEAYQEHVDEQNLERQVLQTQCRRLEAQHYSLSLTAEQLSHTMTELRNQKQKIVSERERIQAELDHLRKCLALPAMQWSRSYFKGYPR
ncbi:genetic suppressor element 1 isoform X1 [Pseudonaja textilis]|uniref:genetic suppressor element 1 isoform X1 n=2 Tax=Pseudonaja textilis TaxID=8673 RepID=UPI000EA88D2E|nr:genetic suppressor element 1 isoform X1 [Pseudonaja textilis]